MPLLPIVITLAVVGLLLYLVNTYLPMEARIKAILNWVVIIIVILWLCNIFGLFAYVGNVRTHR